MKLCSVCSYQNSDTVDSCLHCGAPLRVSCPSCGAIAAPGNRFCAECGVALAQMMDLLCAQCQAPILPGSKFCGQCGYKVESLPAAAIDRAAEDTPLKPPAGSAVLTRAQQAALLQQTQSLLSPALADKMRQAAFDLQGERRDVTVLFLDVMNFTRSTSELDGEDIYLIVDQAMQLMVQVIYKYEGTIDKFTGDGLMALFGAPVAHEDDAARGVRAALEIQTVLQPLQRRLLDQFSAELAARIGINRGVVIAGQLGSNLHAEYTVIGDTANLAARLEQAAQPGQILVSAAVQQQTLPIFDYRPVPPLTLKGYDEQVPAFEPLGRRDLPDRIRGIPGIQVSMVGRASELERLQSLWVAVQRSGQTHIALVSGEAGLGKSRLVSEFRQSFVHSCENVFEGNCLAYTRFNPFWVIASLLRNILQIEESDSPRAQQEKLYDAIHRLRLTEQRIIPYLHNLLGLEQTTPQLQEQLRTMDATMLRRQTHTSVRLFLQAEARRGPMLILLEDIHWIDPASAELLTYLCSSLQDSPILLICNTRQYERQTTVASILRSLQKYPHRFADIQLARLSDPEAHELLANLFSIEDDAYLPLRQSIVERAEGIPFYMEEIVRMLLERKLLVVQDNRLQPATNCTVEMANLPVTLKSLILARFDALDHEQRLLLRHAAVIGRSFSVRLLSHISHMTQDALDRVLHGLAERLFLCEEPIHNEKGYVFRHALIQSAVYSTLLHRDRKQLHGLVALAIEEGAFFAQGERAEILAYHLGESDEPVRAVPYLTAAAENARQRSAHETALRHYRRGLELLQAQDTEDAPPYQDHLFRLSIGLGQTLKLLGDYAGAGQELAQTAQLLANMPLKSPSCRVYHVEALRELADVRQREGSLDKALLYIENAIQQWRRLRKTQPDILWYGLQDRLAWIRFRRGGLDEAAAMAMDAIHCLENQDVAPAALLASLYNTVGGVYYQKRATADAVDFVERSLRLYDSLGYAWGKAIAATNLGLLHYVTGAWDKAGEWYTWAVNVCRENGLVAEQAVVLRNLGLLYLAQGSFSQAEDAYRSALGIAEQIGDNQGAGCSFMGLGLQALYTEQLGQAEEHIAAALAQAEAMGEDNLVQLQLLQAQLAYGQRALEKGIGLAAQARSLASSAELAEEMMEAERILGMLLSAAGQESEAEQHLLASIEQCRRRNDPYRLGQALLALSHHYWKTAQRYPPRRAALTTSGSIAAEESAALFRRLGARSYLQQAERLHLKITGGVLNAKQPQAS